MARYPQIRVRLRSPHPLALVAAVRQAMRLAGLPAAEIERFSAQACGERDPRRIRRVCAEWVDAAQGGAG